MPVNSLRFSVPALGAVVLLLTAACGGAQPGPAATSPPPGARLVDEAAAGRVVGRVMFEGTPPPNPAISMDADPYCNRENANGSTLETVLVHDGGLENVFVYVKDGLDGYHFQTPADPVMLDQQGCRYTPHVLGVRVGQPLEIRNSDATLHNVHAVAAINREFNFGQPLKGLKNTQTFTAREVMIPFRCNVHPWMVAYVGVLDHPYFAVTTGGGHFELTNLPAGTYTLEAWHEKLGTQAQRITIDEQDSREISFTFHAAD